MSQTGTNPASGGSNAGGMNYGTKNVSLLIKLPCHRNDDGGQVLELVTGERAARTSNCS